MTKANKKISEKNGETGRNLATALRLAIVSLVICGIIFPLVVTGFAQVLFPYQANGELVQWNGKFVGSNLIDNNFTLPVFFHSRNDSASGVDPDITIQDALDQVPRIANASGIPQSSIDKVILGNEEGEFWIFGSPYVNVLRLNLILAAQYPSVYDGLIRVSN